MVNGHSAHAAPDSTPTVCEGAKHSLSRQSMVYVVIIKHRTILAVQVAYGLQNEHKQIVVDLRRFSSASSTVEFLSENFLPPPMQVTHLRPWLKRAMAIKTAPNAAPSSEMPVPDVSAYSDTCYITLTQQKIIHLEANSQKHHTSNWYEIVPIENENE